MNKTATTSRVPFTLSKDRPASISGFTTLNGEKYLEFRWSGTTAHLPYKAFLDPSAAKLALAEQGLVVLPKKDWAEIIRAVEEIDAFPLRPRVDKLGWTENCFALMDGQVLSARGTTKIKLVGKPTAAGRVKAGNLKDWRNEVAETLAGQTLPMVVIMAALAAPILRFSSLTHNPGLELCGPRGKGKTLLLGLAQSIADDPSTLTTFDATRIGLSKRSHQFEDRLFAVDESSNIDRADGHFVQSFVFGTSSGATRLTAYNTEVVERRTILLTSANRPFHESLNHLDQETKAAALDRLLPLTVDPDNEYGVFDFLPPRFKTSGELALYLEDRMRAQYGVAIRRFLSVVVNARHDDPAGFKAKLNTMIHKFEVAVGMAATPQGRSRPSSTFGLFYAAGTFARRHRILPDSWDCKSACVAAYRNYIANLPAGTPLPARLLMIASRPATLDLRNGNLPKLSDQQVEHHGAFLKLGKRKRTELLLTDHLVDQLFPDWRAISNGPEFRSMNLRDRDHRTKQRQVRKGHKKERFVCFVLAPEIVAQIDR